MIPVGAIAGLAGAGSGGGGLAASSSTDVKTSGGAKYVYAPATSGGSTLIFGAVIVAVLFLAYKLFRKL